MNNNISNNTSFNFFDRYELNNNYNNNNNNESIELNEQHDLTEDDFTEISCLEINDNDLNNVKQTRENTKTKQLFKNIFTFGISESILNKNLIKAIKKNDVNNVIAALGKGAKTELSLQEWEQLGIEANNDAAEFFISFSKRIITIDNIYYNLCRDNPNFFDFQYDDSRPCYPRSFHYIQCKDLPPLPKLNLISRIMDRYKKYHEYRDERKIETRFAKSYISKVVNDNTPLNQECLKNINKSFQNIIKHNYLDLEFVRDYLFLIKEGKWDKELISKKENIFTFLQQILDWAKNNIRNNNINHNPIELIENKEFSINENASQIEEVEINRKKNNSVSSYDYQKLKLFHNSTKTKLLTAIIENNNKDLLALLEKKDYNDGFTLQEWQYLERRMNWEYNDAANLFIKYCNVNPNSKLMILEGSVLSSSLQTTLFNIQEKLMQSKKGEGSGAYFNHNQMITFIKTTLRENSKDRYSLYHLNNIYQFLIETKTLTPELIYSLFLFIQQDAGLHFINNAEIISKAEIIIQNLMDELNELEKIN